MYVSRLSDIHYKVIEVALNFLAEISSIEAIKIIKQFFDNSEERYYDPYELDVSNEVRFIIE